MKKVSESRYSVGDRLQKFKISLFVVYIFIVLWLTLIDREFGERRAMLVPFWEYTNIIKNIRRNYYAKQILGNLLLLMPLGIMLPMIKKITLKQIFVISFCFSASIELIQFITGRGLMEFDDVFNNTVGAMVGYGIYCFLKIKLQRLKCK